MRSLLIILALFALFLFISCSDDFPPAPEFKFCKVTELGICESIHSVDGKNGIPADECDEIGGRIVNACEEPNP